jgi:hypothetical protein
MLMQDFGGLIGRFSGSEVPSTLSTDTGLLRINFTADGSLQDEGFAAAYLASATPQVFIPTCTDGAKLVQVRKILLLPLIKAKPDMTLLVYV